MQKNVQDWGTKKEFQELSDKVDQGFNKFDQRFERVDKEFIKIDQRFQKVDERFEKVEVRLNRLENKIELCATKKDLEEKFEEAKSYMGVLLEDLKHKLDLVIEVFAPHQEIISDHEKRISNLETDNLVFKSLNFRKTT